MWKSAAEFSKGGGLNNCIRLGQRHWISKKFSPPDGALVAFGTQCPHQAEQLVLGLYDPFQEQALHFALTFIPDDQDLAEIPPPMGSCCTCETFV